MKKQEAKAEWKTLLGDPKISKSRDQRGWITMPAIWVFTPGPQLRVAAVYIV